MREDMAKGVAGLSRKLQKECRRRSEVLEELSSYLRPTEIVEFICPGRFSSGVMVITTERLLFSGNGTENIPLSNIVGTTAPFVQEQMFPNAKSELNVSVRGIGETTFTLAGTFSAREAEKQLKKSLMQ